MARPQPAAALRGAGSLGRPLLYKIAFDARAVDDSEAYPFNVPAIRTLRELTVASRLLFFAGENGSGKSTLLEAIALSFGFGHEGGSPNVFFATQPRSTEGSAEAEGGVGRLANALRLHRRGMQRSGFFLRAESFYNVATYLTQLNDPVVWAAYGGVPLHQRSHGEAFLALARERFSPGALYLLDEPEAALSAARQLALIARLTDLLNEDARTQFIIATQSPILLGIPGAQLLSFDGGRIHDVEYEQTDAYILTRRFLHDRDRVLADLFSDDGA